MKESTKKNQPEGINLHPIRESHQDKNVKTEQESP